MNIETMTASFGCLQNETLVLGPGLTIVQAPNEGGKSTWCAFLRAMLYGIPTRERDTKTALAEKNRYQPWSGAPMEGELTLNWGGRRVTIRRFPKGNVPFGGFEAVDAVTGEPVAGLDGDTLGETLLGVSRDAYERSAFIGQGALPVTQSGELERRIAALVSSGEETVSYSQTEGRLKEWLRRRKHNKSGLIPKLEGQLAQIDATLARLDGARRRQEEAHAELPGLARQKEALEAEQALHRRVAQQKLDLQYGEAKAALDRAAGEESACIAAVARAQSRLEELTCDPLFSAMIPEEAGRTADEDAGKARALEAVPSGRGLLLGTLLLLAALAVTGALLLAEVLPFTTTSLALLACVTAGWGMLLLALRRKRREELARRAAAYAALLARYEAADPDGITARADAYRQAWRKAELAVQQAREAFAAAEARREGTQRLLDSIAAHGGRTRPAAEPVPPPARTPQETADALASVSGALSHLQRELAMVRGEINALGDPAALEADREALREALTRRREEYDAIALALEGLDAANTALRARFSPALNEKAGAVMSALTGGAYDQVALSRTFDALVKEAGGLLPRRTQFLSRGTLDQLYLAVRLAICDLVLPGQDPAPLVLDDALAFFDDRRMALALNQLRALGRTRQVLLFTCHSREADHLAGAADVTFLPLPNGEK